MFTDVANFSGLVGEKEDRTLNAVSRDFTLMKSIIERGEGQVRKTMGDGLLAFFPSAINAVTCAQEIQIALTSPSRLKPSALLLQHRIGIHVGDVFVTENDIVGNGVNVAARLQSCADLDGICISQTVFDVVRHKLTLEVKYMGVKELKHIRDSVPIYFVLATKTPNPTPARISPAIPKPEGKSKFPKLEISSGAGTTVAPKRPSKVRDSAGESFCIGLIGDFSARSGRALVGPLAQRCPIPVDIDTFDEVLAGLSVRLRLPAYNRPGEVIEVPLENIEQFHPDEIIRHVEPLKKLWALRSALLKPASAATASAELRTFLQFAYSGGSASSGQGDAALESDSDTISRLFARPPSGPAANKGKSAPTNPAEAFVRGLVSTSGPQVRDPRQTGELDALELELTRQLRAILNHPEFQSLEAAWLGVQLLVRDFGADQNVKLFLIDASKEELITDLDGHPRGKTSGLAKLLAQQRWDLLLGDLVIGTEVADIELLAKLAKVAVSANAVLIAGAKPELAGCESFARQPDPSDWNISMLPDAAKAWKGLRHSPEAEQVGLALPRFLLRQPYGQRSDPIESFPFEEMATSIPHESYLWGNAAFACGHMIATAVSMSGGADNGLAGGELSGLPLHSFAYEGEKAVKPCAEAWLTERAAALLEKRGFAALLSVRGQDAVRVTRFVSIAHAAKLLSPGRNRG